MPATLNQTWGYRSDDHNWKSPGEVIYKLVDIVSKGGYYLLNVGPLANGEMPQIAQDILRAAGSWLKINGEAVYGALPTPFGDELGERARATRTIRGSPSFSRVPIIASRRSRASFTSRSSRASAIRFILPRMSNNVKRAYRLADGAPFEVKNVNGEWQMQTAGLMKHGSHGGRSSSSRSRATR